MNIIKRLIKNWKINRNYVIRVTNEGDTVHAEGISRLINESAKEREVGIANREPEYLSSKMKEGKGVVAEGFLKDNSFLIAEKILAKHDENYMPPEVAESLKDK